jgi:hypothetical protein
MTAPLKLYDTLEDIGKKYLGIISIIESLQEDKKSKKLRNQYFTNTPPNNIAFLLSTDSAWIHLKVLQLFNIQYTDESRTQLATPTVPTMLSNIPAEGLTGNINTDDALLKDIATRLAPSIQALNKLVTDGVVSTLTTDELLPSQQLGGSLNVNLLKIAIKKFNSDLVNYNTNDIPALITEEEMYGGAFTSGQAKTNMITEQGKDFNTPHTNKSSDLFQELFNNVETILTSYGKTISTGTSGQIQINLDKLRNVENTLIQYFDRLMVSANLENKGSKIVPNGNDTRLYRKLFADKERREYRLAGVLGNLWGFLPIVEKEIVVGVPHLGII